MIQKPCRTGCESPRGSDATGVTHGVQVPYTAEQQLLSLNREGETAAPVDCLVSLAVPWLEHSKEDALAVMPSSAQQD